MSTKRLILFLLLVPLFCLNDYSYGRQTMQLDWSVSTGEYDSEGCRFCPRRIQRNVIIDKDKNIYFIGNVNDFMTYQYYTKYSNSGELDYDVITHSYFDSGGPNENRGSEVDDHGNLYATGNVSGNPNYGTKHGMMNLKLDSEGNKAWMDIFPVDSLNTFHFGVNVHVIHDSLIAFTGRTFVWSNQGDSFAWGNPGDSFILYYDTNGNIVDLITLADMVGYSAEIISSESDQEGNLYLYIEKLESSERKLIKINPVNQKKWEINADSLSRYKIDEKSRLLIVNNDNQLVTVDDSGNTIELLSFEKPESGYYIFRDYSIEKMVYIRKENPHSIKQRHDLVVIESTGVTEIQTDSLGISTILMYDDYFLFEIRSNYYIYHENTIKNLHVLNAELPSFVSGIHECYSGALIKIDADSFFVTLTCNYPDAIPAWGIGSRNKFTIDPLGSFVNPEPPISIESFELRQNYPNPFNSETTISFDISSDTFVKLDIMNITGQNIMRVVDQNMTQGSYDFRVNLNNFSSGIYLYRLESNEGVKIRKMSLIK
jgi:hypothetical protein